MADDIVDRLYEQAQAPALAWLAQAANAIERLRNLVEAIEADNDRLRRALTAADEYNAALRHHNQQLEAHNG